MNPYTEYERFTQRVYQKLVNNEVLKPTSVKHNVKLKGKSGCEHQIDVYWEYEIAGNMNRVAIECKNYDSQVPIGKVRDFFGLLQDLNNVRGIMVSSKGYQDGAKKFASFYGISLKELRRPIWNESIGSITAVFHTAAKHTLFLFDEDWVKEHDFDIDRLRQFYMIFQSTKADYWKTATHFPLETRDGIIRNSKGEKITTLEELEQQLPKNPESGAEIVFPFADGWVESLHWGKVKIREVKYEYESKVQETTWSLAAEDFAEAILKDALDGKMAYISK